MSRAVASHSESDGESDGGPSIDTIPLSRTSGVGTGNPPPLFQRRADIVAGGAGAAAIGFDVSKIELVWTEQPGEYHRARYPKELSKRGNCRGAIEGRDHGVPTLQVCGLAEQPLCPAEVDLTVYVGLPDGRRHPFFYCLTAGRDAPSSCQAVQLGDKTHALRLKARAEDNYICQLKHVGIVRLRQELFETDKLDMNCDAVSAGKSTSASRATRDTVARGGKAGKGKGEVAPSHNNYFRLCVSANIVCADGSYVSTMSDSIKCVSSTQLVQNPHITQILATSQSLVIEDPASTKKQQDMQPEVYVFGKDFASNTRFRVFQRLSSGLTWSSTLEARDFNWLCGHHCCVKLTLPTPPPQLQRPGSPEVLVDAVVHSEKIPSSDVPLSWTNATHFRYPSGPWQRAFNEADLRKEVTMGRVNCRGKPKPSRGTKRGPSEATAADEGRPPKKSKPNGLTPSQVFSSQLPGAQSFTSDVKLCPTFPSNQSASRALKQQSSNNVNANLLKAKTPEAQVLRDAFQRLQNVVSDARKMPNTLINTSNGVMNCALDGLSDWGIMPGLQSSIGVTTGSNSAPVFQVPAPAVLAFDDQFIHQGLSMSSYNPTQGFQFIGGMPDTFGLPSPSSGSASSLSCPQSPESMLSGMDASASGNGQLDFGAGSLMSDGLGVAFSPLSDSTGMESVASSAASSMALTSLQCDQALRSLELPLYPVVSSDAELLTAACSTADILSLANSMCVTSTLNTNQITAISGAFSTQ